MQSYRDNLKLWTSNAKQQSDNPINPLKSLNIIFLETETFLCLRRNRFFRTFSNMKIFLLLEFQYRTLMRNS